MFKCYYTMPCLYLQLLVLPLRVALWPVFKPSRTHQLCLLWEFLSFCASIKLFPTDRETFWRILWCVPWLDADPVVLSSQWITSTWIQQLKASRWLGDVFGKLSSVWRPGLLLQTWTDFRVSQVVSTSSSSYVFYMFTIDLWFEAWPAQLILERCVSWLSSQVPRVPCAESPSKQTQISLLLVLLQQLEQFLHHCLHMIGFCPSSFHDNPAGRI